MDDLTVGGYVSISDNLAQLISIYPNPASDVLNIKIPSNNFSISILDNTGRIVKTSTQKSFNISDIESGIYIVSIDIEGTIVNERLVKF